MRLLICSDGSAQAEHAMRLGALISSACNAQVTLLGIIENRGQSKAILDSVKRGQALLEDKKIAAELVTKPGKPIEEIAHRTEQEQYDLVIIGAARKQERGRFWMSSKSYRIIKEIKPPVLSAAGAGEKIERILICTGGKQYIEGAVTLTGQIALGLGARVALFHVLPEIPAIYAHLPRVDQGQSWLAATHSELGLNLRRSQERLQAQGVQTEVRLGQGPVLDEILREIRRGAYDLVVVGSAPSPSFRTYVLGDISREVVNRASCAVLVGRSQATRSGPGIHWMAWLARLKGRKTSRVAGQRTRQVAALISFRRLSCWNRPPT
jgi:nucleotide-binding universal stress UspA family protein